MGMADKYLRIIEETGVLQHGHFLYTSGRHGESYMQCAKILQYPAYTELFARKIAEDFMNDGIEIVAAPAMGGIIIAYEVARQLGAMSMFVERENERMELRRGFFIPEGAKVLVVEDVVTTGGTVRETMEVVERYGGEVAGVGVFVDRTDGKIDFGKKFSSVLSINLKSYLPEECPLCREGRLPLVKPGSRKIAYR